MGSFLIAMKTTILGRLQQCYDTEEHKRNYLAKNCNLPIDQRSHFYQGLENLSKAIGWNVMFCLFTSFVHLTLGFCPSPIPYSICVACTGGCVSLLAFLTLRIMAEHRDWFKVIENIAQTKLKQEEK